MKSNAENMQTRCLAEIATKVVIADDTDADKAAAFAELNKVAAKICPNDCSDHGTCNGGKCTCDAGILCYNQQINNV